jgi:hypothetical protein
MLVVLWLTGNLKKYGVVPYNGKLSVPSFMKVGQLVTIALISGSQGKDRHSLL